MRLKSFRISESEEIFYTKEYVVPRSWVFDWSVLQYNECVKLCWEKLYWFLHASPQLPQAHKWESLLREKNSNKKTWDLLALSPCLILWSVLSTFGRFSAIPASFFQFFRCSIYRKTTAVLKKLAGMALRRRNMLRTQHRFKQGDKVRNSDVFLLLFLTSK